MQAAAISIVATKLSVADPHRRSGVMALFVGSAGAMIEAALADSRGDRRAARDASNGIADISFHDAATSGAHVQFDVENIQYRIAAVPLVAAGRRVTIDGSTLDELHRRENEAVGAAGRDNWRAEGIK